MQGDQMTRPRELELEPTQAANRLSEGERVVLGLECSNSRRSSGADIRTDCSSSSSRVRLILMLAL